MYLSPQQSYEEGEYFSYPLSNAIRQDNVRTCLPGGFSGSGPEYSMYKSNCFDLMAQQCATEWGAACDAYHSNLNLNEQALFKQMVARRNAPGMLASNNNCARSSHTIVPGQTMMYGMNPMQGGDCLSPMRVTPCPYVAPAATSGPQPFPYAPETTFQSELIHQRMYAEQQKRRKRENFQDGLHEQLMYQNEQMRTKEAFQSDWAAREMMQRAMVPQHMQGGHIIVHPHHTSHGHLSQHPHAAHPPNPPHVPTPHAAQTHEPFQQELVQMHMRAEPSPPVPLPPGPAAQTHEPFQQELIQMHMAPPAGLNLPPQIVPIVSQPEPTPMPFMPSQPEPTPMPFLPSQPEPTPMPFLPSTERHVHFGDNTVFGVTPECEQTACSVSNLME
jgi:hypothetical protein